MPSRVTEHHCCQGLDNKIQLAAASVCYIVCDETNQ